MLTLLSSSSLLPNQKLDDEVDGLDVDAPRLSFAGFEVDFRKKPSIALPITCGSTNELLLSQRKRLFGFRSFSFSFSLKRSKTSLENETVTLAGLRSDFLRAIGWWRFSNQPESAAAPDLSLPLPVIICLALCKIDTSKLFERFDRDIPWSGASVLDDVDGFDLIGDESSTLLISVADEANDVINDLKSVWDTTMPVRLKKLCDGDFAVEVDGVIGTGFSDARLNDAAGIGASAEPTKSEYRRFVYRVELPLVPASPSVCTSHTFSLLVFHSFIRAFRACTMSSIISSWRLWILPIGSVVGGPVDVWLSRREPNTLLIIKNEGQN